MLSVCLPGLSVAACRSLPQPLARTRNPGSLRRFAPEKKPVHLMSFVASVLMFTSATGKPTEALVAKAPAGSCTWVQPNRTVLQSPTTLRKHRDGTISSPALAVEERPRWWWKQGGPGAFEIFDLRNVYPRYYYERDQVSRQFVRPYVTSVLRLATVARGGEEGAVPSVLELGCAGGLFTMAFLHRGASIHAVEGVAAGVQRALKRGIPAERLTHHDLRLPLDLRRTFDVVVNTEVAEHLEPPFSSQLVQNIVRHGNVAWFSATEPETRWAGHVQHPNEQPMVFWANLFAFYGWTLRALDARVVAEQYSRHAKYVAYVTSHPRAAAIDAFVHDLGK